MLKRSQIFLSQQIVMSKLCARPSVAKSFIRFTVRTGDAHEGRGLSNARDAREQNAMNKFKLLTAAAIMATAFIGTAFAENPMVGGAAMYPNKNIVQNALN